MQRRDRVLIVRMENEPSDLCNACLMRRRICLKYRAKDALKAIREEIKKRKQNHKRKREAPTGIAAIHAKGRAA